MITIKKPIITEKSMKLAANNCYSFLVDKSANKLSIGKFVSGRFKVDVLSVRIVNVASEVKMQRKVRKSYQVPGFKKAIVQIKKGQKIALFETPKEEEATVTTAESKPQIMKENRNFLRGTKVKVEKDTARQTTQRKVITGK